MSRSTCRAKVDLRRILAVAVLLVAVSVTLLPGAATAKPNGEVVKVMTRNLYLGADLAVALGAQNANQFADLNGEILRQVTRTNFSVRATALAAEIRKRRPDLVGLQEVALWRTGPKSLAPLQGGEKTATTVRYDFLDLLLDRLNAGRKRYRVVVVEEEADVEAPANENGPAGGGISAADKNGRLTIRDAILARTRAGVKTTKAKGGHFAHLLEVSVSGITLPVTRGWTQVNAVVRDSRKFRFVNTHLEAFDDRSLTPSIRQQQAEQLVAPGGPATGRLPVVLLGDLNSDDDTVVPDDQKAYLALRGAGFVERSTDDPLSCCITDPNLTGGSLADFDHQVDHVMTDARRKVRLIGSSVTGRAQFQGLWPSDHAGVVSKLRIR